MANWLIPVKYTTFNMNDAYEDRVELFWGKHDFTYEVDDIIYFYVTKPIGKIMYKYRVSGFANNHQYPKNQEKYWLEKTELDGYRGEYFLIEPIEKIDKDILSLGYLKQIELISKDDTLQSHKTDKFIKGKSETVINKHKRLLKFISNQFDLTIENSDYPDELNAESETFPEGAKQPVLVNKYERNPKARVECLEIHGTRCKICDMSFAETYGYFAKDFIHVHHIKPLHEIGEEYQVNGKNDLIPVCPNCHAMLHKTENGLPMTVERLKLLFELSNKK